MNCENPQRQVIEHRTGKFIHQLFLVIVTELFWVVDEVGRDGMYIFGRDGHFTEQALVNQSVVRLFMI